MLVLTMRGRNCNNKRTKSSFVTSRDETTADEPQIIYSRKCWNCGQPATDNDLRVCGDPICGQAAISQRARVQNWSQRKKRSAEEVLQAELRSKEYRRKYMREYRKRPGVKERESEYHREWAQRPKVREKIRQRKRKYNQLPEVKEKKREWAERPENKERKRRYDRERYLRLKQLREEE